MKLYSCHACGGAMEWNGESGGLKCGNCGSTVSVGSTVSDGCHPYEDPRSLPGLRSFEETVIRCPGCGAEIRADGKTVSMSCPYCGAGLVFDGRQLQSGKPDAVAPLMISGEKVRQLVKEWSGSHMFAPDLTSKYLEVKFISPQYIPFWVFSAHAETQYDGYAGKARPKGRISWHPVRGSRSDDLENTGVPGDRNIKEDYAGFLFDSTSPEKLTAWRPEYFAGSYSFLPTVSPEDAEAKAKKAMKSEIMSRLEDELRSRRGYNRFSYKSFEVTYSNKAWRLELIPGYFVICRYGGRIYVRAVNGVTGEVYGTYPVSIGKVTIACVCGAAALLLCLLLLDWSGGRLVTEAAGGYSVDWNRVCAGVMFSGAIAAAAWLVTFFRIRLPARGRDDLKNDKWLREIMGKINPSPAGRFPKFIPGIAPFPGAGLSAAGLRPAVYSAA